MLAVLNIKRIQILIIQNIKRLNKMSLSILSGFINFLLPLALLTGAIFRFSIVSVLYGFLLLVLPWLGPLTESTIRVRYRLFIIIIFLVSLLMIIAQISFQSVLLANKPYGHTLKTCSEIVQILRLFGLERLDNSNAIRILRLIFPDIIIFAISIVCLTISRRILISAQRNRTTTNETLLLSSTTTATSSTSTTTSSKQKQSLGTKWPRLLSVLQRIRLFIQFILVGFAAIIYPSIFNSVYFLFFLSLATLWACSIKFGRKYAIFRGLLLIYAGVHLLVYYLYQFGFFQEIFPQKTLWTNITGFTALVTSNCSTNEPHLQYDLPWSDYVNPAVVLLLYFYYAFETSRTIFKRRLVISEYHSHSPDFEEQRRSPIATEAVVVDNSPSNDAPPLQHHRLSRTWSAEHHDDQTWQGRMIYIIISILRVLEKQSYLLSLIAMLAWSITYHSLLTLVFLLWACFIWILPRSRVWCLRLSPFFTFYGTGLLILQYLSGFKISYQQLNFGLNQSFMEQIGIRINEFQPAFIPLLVKSFYMVFFWLTLRQFISEIRNSRTLSEHDTGQGQIRLSSESSTRSYPRRLGRWIVNIMTKYWIFISCGMLLLMSIQQTVVAYRIIYMMFYLFFILSFQISFGFWRRTTAVFHLVIIVYSMIVLIVIYIYQFKAVYDWLQNRIDKVWLLSVGLEDLGTDALAVKLLTPSTFLVVNILQLYYFHSGWMAMITIKSDKNIQGPATATLQDIHKYAKENVKNSEYRQSESILKTKATNWQESLYKLYFRLNRIYKKVTYYAWRFAEIHMYKFVLFAMILVATLNVSAFNVVLIILATIGLALFRLRPLINLLTLIATGLYIVVSMGYQLEVVKQEFIQKDVFIHNCTPSFLNITDNGYLPNDTAKWFGFELTPRIDRYIGLYIFLTLVLTFDAISRYRQRHRRMELSHKFNVHLIENKYSIL
ncbi:unnamed protein product, partial [Didymodactylos carnosus]